MPPSVIWFFHGWRLSHVDICSQDSATERCAGVVAVNHSLFLGHCSQRCALEMSLNRDGLNKALIFGYFHGDRPWEYVREGTA